MRDGVIRVKVIDKDSGKELLSWEDGKFDEMRVVCKMDGQKVEDIERIELLRENQKCCDYTVDLKKK